jgi:hypothetical protein
VALRIVYPAYFGSCSPCRRARTSDRSPSAPTKTSSRSSCPPANRATTPDPSCAKSTSSHPGRTSCPRPDPRGGLEAPPYEPDRRSTDRPRQLSHVPRCEEPPPGVEPLHPFHRPAHRFDLDSELSQGADGVRPEVNAETDLERAQIGSPLEDGYFDARLAQRYRRRQPADVRPDNKYLRGRRDMRCRDALPQVTGRVVSPSDAA